MWKTSTELRRVTFLIALGSVIPSVGSALQFSFVFPEPNGNALAQLNGELYELPSGRKLHLPNQLGQVSYARVDERRKRIVIGDSIRYAVIDIRKFEISKVGSSSAAWFEGNKLVVAVEGNRNSQLYADNVYRGTVDGGGRLIAETAHGKHLLFLRNEHIGRLAILTRTTPGSYTVNRVMNVNVGHDFGLGSSLLSIDGRAFVLSVAEHPDSIGYGTLISSVPRGNEALTGYYAYSGLRRSTSNLVVIFGSDTRSNQRYRITVSPSGRFDAGRTSIVDEVNDHNAHYGATVRSDGLISVFNRDTGRLSLTLGE